jgi:mannose-1-phosphate guanylyltransferase/mannose-6-phosphate isomerase
MIVPVILSGGAGTRLWPMSTEAQPKQFLPLVGETSLLAQTLERVAGQPGYTAPMLVGAARHEALARAALADTGCDARIICEPAARNTAPAILLAAIEVAALHGEDALLLVMPSDHVMTRPEALLAGVAAGAVAARSGALVTFGITPKGPETGYGYLELGDDWPDAPGVRHVARFVEKPPRDRAAAMVADGRHLWNAGIFLFTARTILSAAQTLAPAIAAAAEVAMAAARRDGIVIRPDPDLFATSPSQSIDYAIMEHADMVAAVPVDPGWSDLGSWDALAEMGSVSDSDVTLIDTHGCYVRSDGLKIAALGVSDLIVVASGDHVLILPRGRSQEVKRLLEAMKSGD